MKAPLVWGYSSGSLAKTKSESWRGWGVRARGGGGGKEERVDERGWRSEDLKQRMTMVQWGWSERQIMDWLCRVVVGEVVRAEEGVESG